MSVVHDQIPAQASGRLAGAIRSALIAYWLAMLVAFHWPLEQFPLQSFRWSDKLVHVGLYGGFALLLSVYLDQRARQLGNGKYSRSMVAGLAFTIAVAQGILDEITQPLTHRTFDLWDWAADSLGAVLAIGLWAMLALLCRAGNSNELAQS
ncbi:MAG TPA: VanZ family protein [Pirellulales bacterium]|nr:VanZ family protein [Pirellulales bacterium]